ncbi:IS5 family transposase [Streptomyces sp. NPDC001820]|uniref:IS5 family transposase n=1 Tax=Streptomyces sp. NPDC001820 TaxID=3364613 RepID=UPI0036825BAA
MAWIVSDELWDRIDPLLPRRERRYRYSGRKRLPDRKVLCGILYVLHTGVQWEHPPQDLGFGSGTTCWRRLRGWNEAGVWQRRHKVLLAELNAAAKLDWSRCVVGSSHVTLKGGARRAPRRSTEVRAGSKHHLITDGHGTRFAVLLTGSNRNDVTKLLPLLDAIPPVRSRVVHPVASPRRCSPTAATTATSTANRSTPAESCPQSPAAGPAQTIGLFRKQLDGSRLRSSGTGNADSTSKL